MALTFEVHDSTYNFIRQHRLDDVRQLALRGCSDKSVDLPFALDQIAGWQTARKKLPTWAATDSIIYPPHLNMEQCSSEKTARYKQALIQNLKLKILIDLTGGFGVDFSFMSRAVSHAVYVERNEQLCEIARHNFKALDLDNVEVVCADANAYLSSIADSNHKPQTSNFKPQTIIFLDPARRDVNGHKVFGIEDCTPDVLALKDELLAKADIVMIKLSPMLDWHAAAKAFGSCCREVHIVSVDNECKELLLLLAADGCSETQPLRLVCVNDEQRFEADVLHSNAIPIHYVDEDINLGAFLFVPNASIMKSGCFAEVARTFNLKILDANSHLFVGNENIKDFPGRRFSVIGVTTMNKHELKAKMKGIEQANISVRNFPLSAVELRKRLKVKDGGDVYIFATTIGKQHLLLITRRDNLSV